MTVVKSPNNLTPDQLNRLYDQLRDEAVLLLIDPAGEAISIGSDLIGQVTAVKNTSVEFEITLEFSEYIFRFQELEIFRFEEIGGKFYLFQKAPWGAAV